MIKTHAPEFAYGPLVGLARVATVGPVCAQLAATSRCGTYVVFKPFARVAVARTAVVGGQHTVFTELAYRFGFGDGAHLCRSFKEVVGCSPRELARIARTQTDP